VSARGRGESVATGSLGIGVAQPAVTFEVKVAAGSGLLADAGTGHDGRP